MYHSNIHSEHSSSSNHSSRSGHHEWLSSILLSFGEGAFSCISFVSSPLISDAGKSIASSSTDLHQACDWSVSIVVDATRVFECSNIVTSGSITNSLGVEGSVSRDWEAIDLHAIVNGLSSVVGLSWSLCNLFTCCAGGLVELVAAFEEVREDATRGVGCWCLISTGSSSTMILDTCGCCRTNISDRSGSSIASSINNGVRKDIWKEWRGCILAISITIDNFCPCGSSSTNSSSAVTFVPSKLRWVFLWQVSRVWCACNEKIWYISFTHSLGVNFCSGASCASGSSSTCESLTAVEETSGTVSTSSRSGARSKSSEECNLCINCRSTSCVWVSPWFIHSAVSGWCSVSWCINFCCSWFQSCTSTACCIGEGCNSEFASIAFKTLGRCSSSCGCILAIGTDCTFSVACNLIGPPNIISSVDLWGGHLYSGSAIGSGIVEHSACEWVGSTQSICCLTGTNEEWKSDSFVHCDFLDLIN